jgi:uncharacterized membrane protein
MNYVFISVVLLLLLDFVYVFAFKNTYIALIGKIQNNRKPKINIISAILSYVVVIIGFVFVVVPYINLRIRSGTHNKTIHALKTALISGGLLGFVIYGVFNTTNVALFEDYSITTAIIDIVWGTFLYFISAFCYVILSTSK